MSKLRGMIDAVKRSRVHALETETTHEEYLLRRHLVSNADAIADLIDAAYIHDCSPHRVCPICAALAKLEDDK